MIERFEIRLTGSGGQGMILAGIILGEAAALYEGKNAVQTQSYGPEARGGASRSEVVISDHEIDYPKVTSPDITLVLTQEAADKYGGDLKKGGVLVADSFFVQKLPQVKGKILHLPIIKTTIEKLGKPLFANILALGIICALMENVVSKDSFKKAILDRVPKGTEEKNMEAFGIGYEMGKKALSSLS